jgi:hypothetical protein
MLGKGGRTPTGAGGRSTSLLPARRQRLAIYERGLYRGYFGTYFPGDVLRVSVVSGSVRYWRNDSVLYTSPASSFPLVAEAWLYHTGATLTDVVVSGGWSPP